MNQLIYRFKDFLDAHFPCAVRKLPVHTYLGCPHRQRGEGGCSYCDNAAFSSMGDSAVSVSAQIEEGVARARRSGFTGKFIAYFQTQTNTNADTSVLTRLWRPIYDYREDIVGLSVSTRPDCLPDAVLGLLAELGRDFMVWLELGLQSAHDRTLALINRGHTFSCFKDAVERTKSYPGILTCAHIILGLPKEGEGEMRETVHALNRLKLDGLKIHHLQVVRGTPLEEVYRKGGVATFTAEEYVSLLAALLPYLSAQICLQRLVGEVKEEMLVAPKWSTPKTRIIQLVEQRMHEGGVWQGRWAGV